jgi:hypothetical protein
MAPKSLQSAFHVRIGKTMVQGVHAVGVVARAVDGAVELSLALAGLLELAEPSPAIPGVRLSHANLDSHDTGCGMDQSLLEQGPFRHFFAGRWLTKVKIVTAAQKCFTL